MNSSSSDNARIREEVHHTRKHKPIALLRQLKRVCQRRYVLGIERYFGVRFDRADGNENDVVAFEILLDFGIRQPGKQTSAHLRNCLRPSQRGTEEQNE